MSHDARALVARQVTLHEDLQSLIRSAVAAALSRALEEVVDSMLGVRRGERSEHRQDYRNGSYRRAVLTSVGPIELEVPRTRHSGSPIEVIGRYQRRTPEVDAMIAQAYIEGVSTRGMRKVTGALLGEGVDRSTVSRVTKAIESQVESLRRAPITEPMAYLFLDATFLDTRWARTVEKVAALVAYGVGPDGHRKLLAVTIGARESEDSWRELLDQLIKRGLRGVRLVVADAHAGLGAAVRRALPEASLQRCVVHLERNVLAKAPRRLWKRLGTELRHLFAATSSADARKRLAAFREGLGAQLPEATQVLVEGFAASTRYFAFPAEHWRRIRSTNGVERLHVEIKRRTKAIGAFPDRASALRLVTAVALRATAIWAERRYLNMALLDGEAKAQEVDQAAA